ncbi:unnamed protein product [Phytophthora lilii]|uniref:Unnamed protein product n=1 Tax=Phytophthora lilii TaxID=2077276 RepID=A0A9W6WT47_9STRA|nr:unnamed protein product [Phytophthora lilii]
MNGDEESVSAVIFLAIDSANKISNVFVPPASPLEASATFRDKDKASMGIIRLKALVRGLAIAFHPNSSTKPIRDGANVSFSCSRSKKSGEKQPG